MITLKEAHDALKEKGDGYIIVPQEYIYSRNPKRRYFVMTVEELCEEMTVIGSPRAFQEYINPDVKCRIYIDTEGSVILNEEEIKTFVDLVMEKMTVYLVTKHSIHSPPPPSVLSACRSDKTSFHFIWPVWFESPFHVRGIIEEVFPEPIMGMTFDLNVYPCGNCGKTLRLPYCGKMFRKKEVYKLTPLFSEDKKFNKDVFLQSSVTFNYRNDEEVHTTDKKKSPRLSIHAEISEENRDMLVPLFEWLEIIEPVFECSHIQIRMDKSFIFKTKMFCPFARRIHKSNIGYIFGDKYGSVKYSCFDEDCKHQVKTYPFNLYEL